MSCSSRLLLLLITADVFHALGLSPELTKKYLYKKPGNWNIQRAPANKTRFTEAEKNLILRIHNSYRSLVYPQATDMRELKWDKDLEDYAYNHTQKCTGAHSEGTMVKKYQPNYKPSWYTWYNMGENLYYRFAPWYSIEEAMWMFWEEGSGYDMLTGKCTHHNTCGHYLALVSAKHSRVGCAINTCRKFSVSKYPTPAIFLSCNFDGMVLSGAVPYTVGKVCSKCNATYRSSAPFCRNRLCITPAQYFKKIGYDGNTSEVSLDSDIFAVQNKETVTSAIVKNISQASDVSTSYKPALLCMMLLMYHLLCG